MSDSMGKILLNNVAGDLQGVVFFVVQLSIRFRRLHTFAEGAVHNALFAIRCAIRALSLRRSLAKLQVDRVSHAGDQLLRLP